MAHEFKYLFTPIRVGRLTLKNRIYSSGHAEAMAASRFFGNLSVTPEKILAAHRAATLERLRTGEHRRVLLTTVANTSQFGNGARIAPLARPDDGRLDLVVFKESSRVATICGLPRLFVGGLTRLKGFSVRRIERATIESDCAMLFHVDGEPVQGGTCLEAVVHPRALNVCVR